MNNYKNSDARCINCKYCMGYKTSASVLQHARTGYHCQHPNQKYIIDYFEEHKIQKQHGFIGFSKTDRSFPVKRTPKWCPIAESEVPE